MTAPVKLCDQGEAGKPCLKFLVGETFRKGVDCFLCWWNAKEHPIPQESNIQETVRGNQPTCIHLGQETGDTVSAKDGNGRRHKLVPVRQCRIFRQCTVDDPVPGMACCNPPSGQICRGRLPRTAFPGRKVEEAKSTPPVEAGSLTWVYGVTTVPSRRDTLLPTTLKSLAAAGFDKPTLFVDGATHVEASWWEGQYGLPVVSRYPTIRAFGNWCLAMGELYLRQPKADRYAIFQDDLIMARNTRNYLERLGMPEKGYLNLYSFPAVEVLGKGPGYYQTRQRGWGALALVFTRDSVLDLLTHRHMIERPMDDGRGFQNVDGGIVAAMNKAGWKEFIHNPCLVQHTGRKSSMGHKQFPSSETFVGERYNAMELLGKH